MQRGFGKRALVVGGTVALVVFATSGRLAADLFDLTLIAGPDTASPSGGGNFTGFASPTLVDGTVYYYGATDTTAGIYSSGSGGGPINTIVDSSDAIPGGSGNFEFFSGASVSGSTLAFTGGVNTGDEGVYTISTSGASLTRIADQSTTVPDDFSNRTFEYFVSPTIDGGTVAFIGGPTGLDDGIYTSSGGTLSTLVDDSTDIPGTATNAHFQVLDEPSFANDGTLVFRGKDGFDGGDDNFEGIYTTSGGTLTTVANSETLVPGESVEFDDFGIPSIDGDGKVAFRAEGPDPADPNALRPGGVYTSDGGSLEVVADLNTAAPDGGDFLAFFAGNTPIDGNNVAFTAFHGILATPSTIEEGLYFSRNGVITPLLHVGDTLNGREVEFIFLGQDALEGNTLSFLVQYTDTDGDGIVDRPRAVYTATITPAVVPEPSSMVLLALTGLIGTGLGWRRRRVTALAA